VGCSGAGARRGGVRPLLKSWKTRIWNNPAVSPVIQAARELHDVADSSFPSALIERLNDRLAEQVTAVAAEPAANAPASDCVRALKLLRYDRERAALQREIDRLRDDGSAQSESQIEQLYDRKVHLKRRIEALSAD
jgi:hypothetical protein